MRTDNHVAEEILIRRGAGSRADFMIVYDRLRKGLFDFAYHYLRDNTAAHMT